VAPAASQKRVGKAVLFKPKSTREERASSCCTTRLPTPPVAPAAAQSRGGKAVF
jgi:hypothetical protein